MLPCGAFYDLLRNNDISFFCGVPDTLLKDICAYLSDHARDRHIITANEGNAIALAAGHYLATGKTGLVYMQNSGLDNALDPLTSLVNAEVNRIPILLLIGWRGEPGQKDEPQHIKQGRITVKLLEALEIPFEILPGSAEKCGKSVEKACLFMKKTGTPYALLVRKGAFEPYVSRGRKKASYELNREEAIGLVAECLGPKDVVVSTTGKASRELFEYRERSGQAHNRDFLTVGAMGHASQVALGIALEKPDRRVYCLDGDGAVIMHMGSLAVIGSKAPANFRHIVINNGSHDSVGGGATASLDIDLAAIAGACGYRNALRAETREEAKKDLEILKKSDGLSFLEIRVRGGSRDGLGRPTVTPLANKDNFMDFLRK